MNAIVVFAKYPEPGRVKKKIGQVVGMETSAELCKAVIQDIVDKISDKDYDLYLSFIGRENKENYRCMFPSAILYVQRGTNIGENVKYTFQDLLDDHDKVLIVSGDAPQVNHDLIQRAVNALDLYDVVLGPVEDGGFYLLGMKQFHDVFENMPFGTEQLLEETEAKLKEKKLTFVLMDTLADVDTVDELKRMKDILKKDEAPKTYDVIHDIEL